MYRQGTSPWSLHADLPPGINFCIWVLQRDGLAVPPFDRHPPGDGSLQALGLNAGLWLSWFTETVIGQRSPANPSLARIGTPSSNNVFKSCGNAIFQAHVIGTGPREKKSARSFPLQKSLHSFGMICFLSRGAYPRCASSASSILTSFLLLFLRFLLSLVSIKHHAQALKRGDIFFKLRKNFRGRENNVFSSHATSAKQASSLNVRMSHYSLDVYNAV